MTRQGCAILKTWRPRQIPSQSKSISQPVPAWILSGRMGMCPIIRSRFCGMPAPARCATRSGVRATGSRGRLRNWRREACPCSKLQRSLGAPREWESTRSASTGMMGTSWGSTRGPFCGKCARAKSASGARLGRRNSLSNLYRKVRQGLAKLAKKNRDGLPSEQCKTSTLFKSFAPKLFPHRFRAQKWDS